MPYIGDNYFHKGQIPWNKKTPIKSACLSCKKEFESQPSQNRKYCSRNCYVEEWKTRVPAWNKGIGPEKPKCLVCGKKLTVHYATYCRRHAQSLERHHAWAGGKGTERSKFMHLKEYKEWRQAVFVRDNFTCQLCKKTNVYVEADHIMSYAYFPEYRLDVSNGRTLCRNCHLNHTFYAKEKGEEIFKMGWF